MKINANTELLKNALAAAAAFCSARSTMPILANVRLGADFGSLVISATNLTAGATIGMPCAVQEPGVTTVNAGDILGIISTLEAEFVTIETDQAGTNLQITCPGYKGKLPTIAASEFPLIKSEMPETKFAVPTAQFIAALNAVTLTASKDDSRPVLTGIEFTMTADCIQMAATDGYRLTVDRIEAGTGIPEKTTLVVPARNLELIAKLAKDAGEAMEIGFTESDFCAAFAAGDGSGQTALIGSAVYDPKFPDYRAIVPKTQTTKVAVSAAQLKKATQLAMLADKKKVRIIEFDFGPDELTLSATSDTGQAAAQVATQMEGAPLTIKFNGAYILDMITGMPNDALMFEMTTPSRPAAIYSFTAGKDAHLAILMPMHPGR